MRKVLLYICSVFILGGMTSCEDFLDKREDVGLTEDDIFRDYYSLRGFLDQSFNQLENVMVMDNWENGRAFVGLFADEMATTDNSSAVFTLHSGNWLSNAKSSTTFEIGNGGSTAISRSYKALRINNRIINDIDKAPLTPEQKNEILGQAYFYRSWFYFQIIKRYGGMPIIDKVFEGGDDDISRITYHESHDWMMEDIQKAIYMLPDSWDDPNYGRPTKIAAMALKEWAQLFDASRHPAFSSTPRTGYAPLSCRGNPDPAEVTLRPVNRPPAKSGQTVVSWSEFPVCEVRKSRNRLWKMIGPLTWTKNHPSCGCFIPNLDLAPSA